MVSPPTSLDIAENNVYGEILHFVMAVTSDNILEGQATFHILPFRPLQTYFPSDEIYLLKDFLGTIKDAAVPNMHSFALSSGKANKGSLNKINDRKIAF